MHWTPGDITFDIVAEESDHPVVVVAINTPDGELRIMADVEERGRTLRLIGFHIQGGTPNQVGVRNLRVLADAVMEKMDYDAIEVEGAPRTTGASEGGRPSLRFTRRSRPATRT